MAFTKYTWHKIADRIDEINFSSNNIAVAKLEDDTICVGRFGKDLFAFAYQCPHAGGLMSEGQIDEGGNVICPVHEIRFDIKTGENVSGEGFQLKTWPVELRKNGVYVGVGERVGFWKLFR